MSLEKAQQLEDIRIKQEQVNADLTNLRFTVRKEKIAEAVSAFNSFLTSKRFTITRSQGIQNTINGVYGKNISFVLRLPDTSTNNVLGGPRLILEVKDGESNTRNFSIGIFTESDINRNSSFITTVSQLIELSFEQKIEEAQKALNIVEKDLADLKSISWVYSCREEVNSNQRTKRKPFNNTFATFTELLNSIESEIFGK